MLLIRRENVNRHNENSARINLRTSQLQKQKVATMQMELDRLHGSATRGSGLDVVRINRMNTLKQIIGKYK
jgi:hypothetical protein